MMNKKNHKKQGFMVSVFLGMLLGLYLTSDRDHRMKGGFLKPIKRTFIRRLIDVREAG
ncbi:hypothetical protein GF340_03805 [Candidatus Peregrinibacteria bacterium]|nr:hypothetical protein [Candidatus Peregrinibacteria bacterium]